MDGVKEMIKLKELLTLQQFGISNYLKEITNRPMMPKMLPTAILVLLTMEQQQLLSRDSGI